MPGFYGQSTAVPLLLSVYSRLARTNSPCQRQPNTVSEAEVCWPLGRKTSATLPEAWFAASGAWLLEGRDPPTLPDPMDWPSPLRQVALTVDGKPTLPAATMRHNPLFERSGRCRWSHGAHRRAAGAAARGCAGEGQSAEQQAPSASWRWGGNLIRSQRYRLQPRVLGGVGKPAWFLNDQQLRWDGDQVVSKAGRYQLVVVDEAGNTIASSFGWKTPPEAW